MGTCHVSSLFTVCSVFDFGEQDGTYYIAMDYLVGEPLSRILAVCSTLDQRGGRARMLIGARIVEHYPLAMLQEDFEHSGKIIKGLGGRPPGDEYRDEDGALDYALRRSAADFALGVDRLVELQRRLLIAAQPLVRAGGRLVYSVCTVTTAETLGHVAAIGPGFEPVAIEPGERWRPIAANGVMVLPHDHDTDGMTVLAWQRLV